MSYVSKSTVGIDALLVRTAGDWIHLEMKTNGYENGDIDIRSVEQAEALVLMLQQALRSIRGGQ